MQSIILPIFKRPLPSGIASQIVGVQPMTGPVGRIFNMTIISNISLKVRTATGITNIIVMCGSNSTVTRCKISEIYYDCVFECSSNQIKLTSHHETTKNTISINLDEWYDACADLDINLRVAISE